MTLYEQCWIAHTVHVMWQSPIYAVPGRRACGSVIPLRNTDTDPHLPRMVTADETCAQLVRETLSELIGMMQIMLVSSPRSRWIIQSTTW